MRTEQAVTGAEGIPVGYATLVVVYAGLIGVAYFMLRRLAKQGPEPIGKTGPGDIEVLP
jgi:hypothetical protein